MITRAEALRLDGANLYVGWDDDYKWWGIFGAESGFCYASYMDKEEAEKDLERRKERYGI